MNIFNKVIMIFFMIFIFFSCGKENTVEKLSCGDKSEECSQKCVDNNESYECLCDAGYSLNEDGKSCDNIDDCKADSCPENSECVDGIDTFTCNCNETYTGENCELCIDGYELFGETCLKSPKVAEWGTKGDDFGYGFVFDSKNNIYVIGDTYKSNRSYKYIMFLTKFNDKMELLWTKEFDYDKSFISFITIDKDDNLYVGTSTEDNIRNENKGLFDISLMKLDTEGKIIWDRLIGTVNDDEAREIKLDDDGNIYMIGYEETYTYDAFGEVEFHNLMLTLRKLNNDGEELWIKKEKVYEDDFMKSVYNIAIDKNNYIYVATNTTASVEETESNGQNDIIIFKYNPSGDKIWVKQYGTENHDSVNEIIIKNNEVYITGYINGKFSQFDKFGMGNIYIMKLDSMGEILFNKKWESDYYYVRGMGIAISDNNEIYLSGYYGDTNRGMILTKLSESGEEIWTSYLENLSSSLNETIERSILTSIAFDKKGVLYGLGLKDGSGYSSVEVSYNPLLLKFDF